ncbi:MAG: hypothetical protein J2P41_01290 [Blastocatellia bacterium]|nr:hypothetical protein [Blastocatellia bacterium]
MINPFGSKSKNDPAQIAAIKSWVVEYFHLSEEVPLMVTELQCTEEGCPPLETVIAILDTPGNVRQYKVFKPLAEVAAEDIAATASGTAENHHEY